MLVAHTSKDLDLLARLMRAEAVGEGKLGMLMVGNVGINRIVGNCLDFKNIRSIQDMIYQSPGGFAGVGSQLFFGSSTTKEKQLARRVLNGEDFYPATEALWFYSPKEKQNCLPTWFGQRNAGRYKKHCFYEPDPGVCINLY